jgi:poly(A) polymerase
VKLPEAPWQRMEAMPRLLAALDAAKGATRFVGGCVRDTLLGLAVSDVDLATRLAPEEVMKRIRKAGLKPIPTGLAHGTVTAVIGRKATVEITTLRRDVATDGRRATIAYTGDWREDAARRDFTINALSADPASLEIFDYFGGLADLDAHRVRFIGDPIARIAEDHLRILRFFRFHARFGEGQPEEAALAACIERRNDLLALSRERKADELLKLLALPNPEPTIALMAAHGILACLLPEADDQTIERLARLVRREQALDISPDGLRRLAALLPRDPAAADAAGGRLRLSNNARARLHVLAELPLPGRSPRRLAAEVNSADPRDLFLLADIGEDELAAAITSLSDWRVPEFPIKGGDIVALGLRPGPRVAASLAQLRRDWIDADFPDEDWVRTRAAQLVAESLRDQH